MDYQKGQVEFIPDQGANFFDENGVVIDKNNRDLRNTGEQMLRFNSAEIDMGSDELERNVVETNVALKTPEEAGLVHKDGQGSVLSHDNAMEFGDIKNDASDRLSIGAYNGLMNVEKKLNADGDIADFYASIRGENSDNGGKLGAVGAFLDGTYGRKIGGAN